MMGDLEFNFDEFENMDNSGSNMLFKRMKSRTLSPQRVYGVKQIEKDNIDEKKTDGKESSTKY